MLELINSTGSYFLGYPVLIEHLLMTATLLSSLVSHICYLVPGTWYMVPGSEGYLGERGQSRIPS